jgi:hypothetical protein
MIILFVCAFLFVFVFYELWRILVDDGGGSAGPGSSRSEYVMPVYVVRYSNVKRLPTSIINYSASLRDKKCLADACAMMQQLSRTSYRLYLVEKVPRSGCKELKGA